MAACKAAIDKWLEPRENDGDGGSVCTQCGPVTARWMAVSAWRDDVTAWRNGVSFWSVTTFQRGVYGVTTFQVRMKWTRPFGALPRNERRSSTCTKCAPSPALGLGYTVATSLRLRARRFPPWNRQRARPGSALTWQTDVTVADAIMPNAERTLNPARMFTESLTPRPELENSLGHKPTFALV